MKKISLRGLKDVANYDVLKSLLLTSIISFVCSIALIFIKNTGRYSGGTFTYFLGVCFVSPFLIELLYCFAIKTISNFFENTNILHIGYWSEKTILKSNFLKRCNVMGCLVFFATFFPMIYLLSNTFDALNILLTLVISAYYFFKNNNYVLPAIIFSFSKVVEYCVMISNIPFVLGITIPLIIILAFALLFYLNRRNAKRKI